MIGIPVTITDIETAVQNFFAIPAAVAILSAVLALGLVPIVAGALRSLVGRH